MTDWFELAKNDKGRSSVVLKAANSQVIGTRQMYAAQGGRTTGIESVKANGPGTDMREV